jgi:quinol monooxygenase YgiN
MYGRQARFMAQDGKRKAFVEILCRAAELVGRLPGCRLYVVGEDLADERAIWVTEIWDDAAVYQASLQDGRVRSLIQEALPLIAGQPEGFALNIAGGHGLAA